VIAVAVDTSGSISNDVLNTFGAEIKGIFDFARPTEVHVIYCDSEVQHVDVFKQGEELHFELHGGGGTSSKPPFEYIAEQGITPEVLVYLTDLEGPFPDPAEFPVLWCSIEDHEAPFGKTIHIRA
jgi:predicted metal-dependent peptidase